MNGFDIAILAILALCVLFGYYQGFLRSLIQVLAFFVSWIFALVVGPLFRGLFVNTDWFQSLRFYIDGAEYIGNNMELARLPVSQLTAAQTQQVMQQNSLPFPLPRLLEQNLATEAFVSQGYTTVSQTITETILQFSLNIICFLLAYFILRIIISIAVTYYDKIVGLPVLRNYDSLVGAGFGLVHGFFLLFVIALIIPVLLAAIQQMGASNLINVKISTWIQESPLTQFFYRSNFLLNMIKGV